MTHLVTAPALSADGASGARDRSGVRLTEARRDVMDLLGQAPSPLDAETIYARLRDVGCRRNRASIYRALQHLQARGAVLSYAVGRRRVFRVADATPVVRILDRLTGQPSLADIGAVTAQIEAALEAQGLQLRGYVELHVAPLSNGAGAA